MRNSSFDLNVNAQLPHLMEESMRARLFGGSDCIELVCCNCVDVPLSNNKKNANGNLQIN